MKSILLRAGLLTCLILLCWSYQEASAETAWTSKCASYGEVEPNQNPSFQHLNCLLTNAALEVKIPPEVVKALAEQESGWRQFDENGQPVISQDGGIGLMQVTNQSSYDQQKLKDDIYYNIQAGVEILASMYNRTDLPKIKGAGPEVIENWYFPIMAYNGTKPVNSPLYQSDGSKNTNAYQEKVLALLEHDSFLDAAKLGQFPFSTADFVYQPDSSENIVFKTMEYTITDQLHASAYLFQKGDQVVVTNDGVHVRSQPSSTSSSILLAKNTILVIDGDFVYDQSVSSKNQFVWYPVKTVDQKIAGYISSAYIMKKLDVPFVNPVDDNDVFLSGKVPGNVRIQIMNGTTLIGSTMADASGSFKAEIPAQNAGTKLTVAYMDKMNALSPSTTMIVTDKTAPLAPSVNVLTDKSTVVTGTAEANTLVYVKTGTTIIGRGKTDGTGKYMVTIPVQKAGTKVGVVVRDGAGNYSPYTTVTLQDKTAPLAPKVNIITDKSTAVTGTAEANTLVYVKVGSTIIGRGKTNADGNYSVIIPVQKAGTKVGVVVKDGAGNYSPYTTVTVQDKTAPLAPKVNSVTDKDTTVTGTAEANTLVYVKVGSTIIGRGKTDGTGKYMATIPLQKAGTKVGVVVRDGAGNYSPYTIITVSNK